MEAVVLSAKQKDLLRLYAMKCHPSLSDPHDPVLEGMRKGNWLIFKPQDHINDRGAAYAVTQCGISFSDFIKWHNWERRLGQYIQIAKEKGFKSRELLDIFFEERYKILIRYDSFNGDGAESIPVPLDRATAEILIALLERPEVPLKAVQNYYNQFDYEGTASGINTKPDMIAFFKSQLNATAAENQQIR